ncbi:signal recognition particle 9 kDa protein (SRP9) domain-containing protein [Sarocladium implicatum]|nr:signal recognition particle 9 kDa protein (SRP9) domain-containing protein [Sarocladium implicatum]
MPYFETSQEWLDQSLLLLEARPETTRITTKYSLKPLPPRPSKTEDATTTSDSAAPTAPRGHLVLKTYDPDSGVTLKYRTTKAAEVSRLVQASLGRLGKAMAGLPADAPEVEMQDAPQEEAPATTGQGQQAGAGGGGGKKKKKGKK